MRALGWVSAGVGAVWLAMSVTYPFGWDQGLFSWAGGVIVRGGMPYADAWDMKGPLVYYIYAAAELAFGVHLWSIRIIDAVLLIFAAMAVLRAAAALTDAVTARWAALIFFLWYASQSYWHTAQPDGWTGMLLIIALAPLLSRTAPMSVSRALGIGFCVGLATLFKPLWATFLLLPLIHVVTTQPPRRAVPALGVVVGWLLPLALTVGWFSLRGALDDLIAVHLEYSAFYAGLSPGNRMRGLADYVLTSRVISVALPIVAYGSVMLWRRRRPAAIMLGAWMALVVGGVVLQNRFFAYHWLPLLPAATLLGAVGLHDVRLRMPALAHICCAVIVVHCLAPLVLEEARFASWMIGHTSTASYYDAYGQAGDDMKAVKWLQENGRPGDVYVFGWQGGVAWLSSRQTVSRFGFSMPLMVGDGEGIRARYRDELLEALAATPPRYILVGPQSDRIIGARVSLADFPELADLVSRRYQQVAQFGALTIHEIRP